MQTVDYHVLLLLTKKLQDIIPENSPLSGRVESECPLAGLIFCCLNSSDFFRRLSSALLLTLFGGQLSKLFTTCDESCAKRFSNTSKHPRLWNMDLHLSNESSWPSLTSKVATTSQTALHCVVSIPNSLPRTSIESLQLSKRRIMLSRKEGGLVPPDSKKK